MDSALITFLANAGIAGVVIVLIVFGFLVPKPTHTRALEDSAHKDEEITRLQEALALERQRSNDATQAATVTNQLIGALTSLATEHREAAGKALPAGLDLTGKDLGL